MNDIFNKDDILELIPVVKYFIIGALICTASVLAATIMFIVNNEFVLSAKVLIIFIFTLVFINIGFLIIIKKGLNIIKKHILNLNRIKNNEDINVMYSVSNKFRFIKESEALINKNINNKYALVHYDINKFTIINNTVGYKIGDEILQEIGRTLRKNLRNEIIGKGEGDNFFVLFSYKSEVDLIERVCYVSNKMENMSIWSKISLTPAVKAGIYLIDNNNLDIRTAIDKAYFAKISLKKSYVSGYALFDHSIESNIIEIKRIEDDMYKALEENEFKVYLQPKIDLKTGEISGAEALVRWQHPELGLLTPNRFIPIFEDNGFIVNLDKYVFEHVCKSINRWSKLGYQLVPISVNVSRVHFSNNNLVLDYKNIKEKYKIPDNLVEIEITESVIFSNENENEIFKIMKKFREYGFEISMDDFGSGYSCLGLLKEMPVDTLKLDRMFLKNIEDYSSQAIVTNIVNMAKSLDLNVVSEGVETNIQVDFLRGIGCDMAQGFIFAKPEPMDKYEDLINNRKINYYDIAI